MQGLRGSTVEENDLALTLSTFGQELTTEPAPDRPAAFRVAVEGESRELHPIVRDEIYKIGAEALWNAFRHAQARHLEVDIRYGDDEFRLRVRDDGRGIDREVLASEGIDGHYGLRGMPERAALIGETRGVERSRGGDGGGAAASGQRGVRYVPEGLLGVTAVRLPDTGMA